MWRDIFLNNKDAVLDMLGRFTEDLTALQRAIRSATATRSIACSRMHAPFAEASFRGQDTPAPNFGRNARATTGTPEKKA